MGGLDNYYRGINHDSPPAFLPNTDLLNGIVGPPILPVGSGSLGWAGCVGARFDLVQGRRSAAYGRVRDVGTCAIIHSQQFPHTAPGEERAGKPWEDSAMTYIPLSGIVAAAILATWPISSGARADAQSETASKVTSEVSFPISCAPDSQKMFNQAVWTLHSFWYPEALKGFTDIAKAEPGCSMTNTRWCIFRAMMPPPCIARAGCPSAT